MEPPDGETPGSMIVEQYNFMNLAAHQSISHRSSDHQPGGHEPDTHEPSSHRSRSHGPVNHEPVSHEPDGTGPSSHEPASADVVGVFAGGLTVIGETGHMTGMRKFPCREAVQVGMEGLAGDEIADRRFHGGPDKAVHLYAVEYYDALCETFPSPDEAFRCGAFGENLSLAGLTDDEVCIGDVFTVGSVVLQLSQPRSPCWKLNARFGVPELSRYIQDERMTGWYARVLQPGILRAGDVLCLAERAPDACSVAEFWDRVLAPTPDVERLQALVDSGALASDWRRRLSQRVQWLRGQAA